MKNLVWNFIKRLASLNIAVAILFFISIFSIIGSIIEQDQTLDYYQNYYPNFNGKSFFLSWPIIINLGLNHVYTTWWFISLLILFTMSLSICTFSVQLPSLKNARRWKFNHSNSSKNMGFIDNMNSSEFENSRVNMIYSLANKNFYIFHKRYDVYGYKGLIGRFAPIIVHFSIIITLFSSIISLFFGCVTQEMVPVGEIFHLKNVVSSGLYSCLPNNFIARVNDFYIDYNDDFSIKQFFSYLSVFDNNGQLKFDQRISVNSPMKFSNFTFYQTDWRISAIRLRLGDSGVNSPNVQKDINKIKLNGKSCWLCNLPIDSHRQYFLVIFNLGDDIFLYGSRGNFISRISFNQKFYINNIPLTIVSLIIDTGLQIKTDPGVFFIYLGFLFLILSSCISYLSYSQVWIYMFSNVTSLMCSTNRSVLFFEEEVSKLYKRYINYTFTYFSDNNLIFKNFLR